jgi:ribosomal protein S4
MYANTCARMKSRKELWKRLNELNKRREVVEAQIIASMKTVELETNVIRHEISAVLEGRIQDIEDRTDMRA